MSIRAVLRRQITEAWRESIATDYAAQRINSERSLQASLWAQLNKLLPPNNRRMFIEPGLVAKSPDKVFRYPDIVICNRREVIGIIELKYQPRAQPSWQKDLKTFEWIVEHRKQIWVSNARYRGIAADDRRYPLAKDVLFVWAGVHAQCGIKLSDHWPKEQAASFLAMHAETMPQQSPEVR